MYLFAFVLLSVSAFFIFVFVCIFVCTSLAGGVGPEEAVSVTGWVTIDV